MVAIHFFAEQVPEGGFVARTIGVGIFTEADDLEALQDQVRDAVHCHFEPGEAPGLVRLHTTQGEVLTL